MNLTAWTLCLALPAFAGDGVDVDSGRQDAFRYWKAGVGAVLSGDVKIADGLWRRCLESDPSNEDCRAGLVLLGHEELRTKAAPPPEFKPEQGLKRDARVSIEGRMDKANALKNWKTGAKSFQTGDLRQAHDAWTRCLELDPSNAECADGLERIQAAGAVFGPKKAANKAAAERLSGQGMRHFMNKRPEDARKAWEQCLKEDPSSEECAAGLKRLGR